MRMTGDRTLVDLCSGAGGPVEDLVRELPKYLDGQRVHARLTDLYPSTAAAADIETRSGGRVVFDKRPVDARSAQVPTGFRTIFGSFHHFNDTDAQAILRSAVETAQGIMVCEMTSRSLYGLVVTTVGAWLVAYVLAPFLRPFSLRRLFFSWCLPVVPATIAIDGAVSCLRTRSHAELARLAVRADPDGLYEWRVDGAWTKPDGIFFKGIYVSHLIGIPKRKRKSLRPATRSSAAKHPRLDSASVPTETVQPAPELLLPSSDDDKKASGKSARRRKKK